MKYESYSEQSANDSKNEEFRKNDFVSLASSLSEINFEASVVVNFFFSFDSDIIASDYDEEFASLSSYFSSVIVASSRTTISTILSAQQRLNQISHSSRRSIERVRVKFKHQLKLKLQERADATKKKKIKVKRETTKVKKNVKLMTSRKKNVSQLKKNFRFLFSQ